MSFGRRELRDILVAFLVLSFVFAYPEALTQPTFFLLSMIAVGVAFVGHELSHRYVARRFGYFAAFRLWPQGLLLAFLFTFVTNGAFIFAAPGAVVFGSPYIFKEHRKDEVGKIGVAGPVFNLLMYGVFMTLAFLFTIPELAFAARINAWLALFNLIPIAPLDGQKVLSWNKGAWGAALILAGLGVFAF
ncbi:MAG: site-2 protease family protein [Nanoarchaeota archaeon]|nr:site-2 protease family protein [Nanoarchaeota archaeon]